jgi:hypothetical protein
VGRSSGGAERKRPAARVRVGCGEGDATNAARSCLDAMSCGWDEDAASILYPEASQR